MIKLIKALYKKKLLTLLGIWYLLNSIHIVGINLMALLYVRQKLSPNQIAINENDTGTDYRTLFNQSQHLAKQLAIHFEIKSHQKVAIIAHNHLLLVHTLFAMTRLGVDVYLINTELSTNQLKSVHENVGFDWIIYDPEIECLPNVKSLPIYHESLMSIHSLLASTLAIDIKIKTTHFSKITVLTSGTTGRFKLAERNSKAQNFISPFCQLLVKLNLFRYQKIYIATPIYHGFGMASLCIAVLLGATMFLSKKFDSQKACRLIASNQIEVVTLVPLMLNRMLKCSKHQLTSLKCIITGGAPITAILVDQVIATLGKILFNLYGTSEAGVCMIASPDDLSIKPETIGRPLRGLSTKLQKQNNESQKHHELFIKCAWSTVGNHWVSTGDLVYQDADGYYFLAGRVDDMIVSGGENVYPYELEHCLSTHPEINDVTVISVPDEEFGQRLVAFIVLNPNTEQSETKIQKWLKSKIARYQMPKKIIFIDELPMTSIGKIDRKKLQQLFFTHSSNV